LVDIRKNAKWLFLLNFCEISVQSILKIVLAYMLSPEAIGVVGVALILIGLLQSLSQTGVYAALIQQKNKIEDYLDTGWSLEIIRGIILFLVIFGLSPSYIEYMVGNRNQEYIAVVQVLATTMIIDSCKNIGVVLFDREINFRQVLKLQITGLIIRTLSVFLLTLYLQNYWGIVYGTVLGSLTIFFMSYVFSEYRPRFNIDFSKCIELLNFGGWVFAYSIAGFLALKTADIFVLKYTDVAQLAIFQMAFFMAMLMRNSISEIQNRIIFPLVSSFKQDLMKIEKLFIESMIMSFSFYVPAGLGLAVLSDAIVKMLFNELWISISNILPILAVAGIFAALVRVIEQFYKGYGVPVYVFISQTMMIFILIFSIFFIFDYSLFGISCSLLLTLFLQFFILFIHSILFFKIQSKILFKSFFLILFGTLIMSTLLIYLINIFEIEGISMILMMMIIGIVIYFVYLFMVATILNDNGIKKLLSNLRSTEVKSTRF